MLEWCEAEFLEFFGVDVDDRDAPHAYVYEVPSRGLRLRLTILALEGTIVVEVFSDVLPRPVVTLRRDLCDHVHITEGSGFRRCFEAGVTEHPVTTHMGIPPILARGVRIYLEPQIQIELIQPMYDRSA